MTENAGAKPASPVPAEPSANLPPEQGAYLPPEPGAFYPPVPGPAPAGVVPGRGIPAGLLLVAAIAIGVIGGVASGIVLGSASASLLTRPSAAPARPELHPFPQDFPEGSKVVLAGVRQADLKARGARNGFRCTESEPAKLDNYSILYCSGKDWTTRFQAEYLPSGEVTLLTVRCHAPLKSPQACDELFTDIATIAFTGQPGLRDEAVAWVKGHVRQNASTSLGSVDIVAKLQDESMTFSGRG